MAQSRSKGPGPEGSGPGGAPPPSPSGPKRKPTSAPKRAPRPRPAPAPRTEKAGSVTKSVQENRASRFLSEVMAELRKVSWPTRAQLLQATAVVIIFVTIVTIYLAIVDAAMSRLVEAIF